MFSITAWRSTTPGHSMPCHASFHTHVGLSSPTAGLGPSTLLRGVPVSEPSSSCSRMFWKPSPPPTDTAPMPVAGEAAVVRKEKRAPSPTPSHATPRANTGTAMSTCVGLCAYATERAPVLAPPHTASTPAKPAKVTLVRKSCVARVLGRPKRFSQGMAHRRWGRLGGRHTGSEPSTVHVFPRLVYCDPSSPTRRYAAPRVLPQAAPVAVTSAAVAARQKEEGVHAAPPAAAAAVAGPAPTMATPCSSLKDCASEPTTKLRDTPMWLSATTLRSSAKSASPSTASTPTCAAFATSQPSERVPHQRAPGDAERGVGRINTPTTAA